MNQQEIKNQVWKVGNNDYTDKHKMIAAEMTYGKGINPESVPEMYKCFKLLHEAWQHNYLLSAKEINRIEKALHNAKIKNHE